jgi:hypothetical protein
VGRFEQLRDRLPSLYRPDDDDTADEPLPLRADDVADMFCEPPQVPRLATADRHVLVQLSTPALLREVRLTSGAAPGAGYAIEALALEPDAPPGKRQAVAGLQNGVATFTVDFRSARFAVRLKRRGLLTVVLRSTADVLEDVNNAATNVMQGHWFEFADRAHYSPYYLRARQLRGLPPPDPASAVDRFDMEQFPFIADLARLGSLLAIPPWPSPTTDIAARDLVEAYRERIRRIVALYTQGLGTVPALRAMVEALGLVDVTAPPEQRDRGIFIEEFAPLIRDVVAIESPGAPTDMVGPLMRWSLRNTGLAPAAPTVIIQGVAPEPDEVDPTTNPVIELLSAGGHRRRVGLAYRATLAPGQALRLQPVGASWIALDQSNGVQRSISQPSAAYPADLTAPGPWSAVSSSPVARAVAFVQAQDQTLWVATNAQTGDGALRRFNGQTWSLGASGLATIRCVVEDVPGQRLLIGTDTGLLRMPLFAPGGFSTSPVGSLAGQSVFALSREQDGSWLVGTATGLSRLAANDALTSAGLPVSTPVRAVTRAGGALLVCTDLGLFEYQAAADTWFWYAGGEFGETNRDWQRFVASDAANTSPTAQRVFLPPVTCVHRGPDASLWVGTQRGITRYVALRTSGLSFTTLLEAYPDLTDGPVHSIVEDERGIVWFATDRGLFRYDGRDFWQFQAGASAWVQLGRADRLYAPFPGDRGAWRFARSSGTWQRHALDVRAGWENAEVSLRSSPETAVRAVAWTDMVAADLGSWDGSKFTVSGPADPVALRVRFKPEETRVLDGGVPALPRVTVGPSVWRYIAHEPTPPQEPADRPAWTCEGRLLPPPPGTEPAYPGRYDIQDPPEQSEFDEAVFAFNPAARVWFAWEARRPLTILARLKERSPGEQIDPTVLDRVWQGIQQVRPAGVRAVLAVEDVIVRGRD